MNKTEDSIVVDGKILTIQSTTGKPVRIVYEGETITEEYATERLLSLIDSIKPY